MRRGTWFKLTLNGRQTERHGVSNMSPGSSAPAMPNLHIEVTEQQHPLPVKHTGSSGNLLPGSPGSADSQRAAPGHAFFGALDEPPVAREAKTPDFGMPMTRHPIDASQKKAAVLAIPDEALEHTEPDSDADHARRRLCQDVLDAAPVLADGGFELASGSGEDQHPLVALAKKAIRALQVDKDPAKFADCFDDHAEIVWHRVAQGKETHKITDREGFEMFARGTSTPMISL